MSITVKEQKRSPFVNWMIHYFKDMSPSPKLLCAKFGLNWPSGSGENYFLILSIYICYFVIYYYSLCGNEVWWGHGLSFEQTWIPFT